jgi:hypothetical protein
MWFRFASLLIVFAVVASPVASGENRRADRAAEADHRRCLENGLQPGTAKYVACRKQLAGRRDAERGRREAEEGGWWPFDSAAFSCKFWGYKPGTAAFDECRTRSQVAEDQRRQIEKQQTDCLRSGFGSITPLGGNNFIVNCPTGPVNCPGNVHCPICPGSFNCPR